MHSSKNANQCLVDDAKDQDAYQTAEGRIGCLWMRGLRPVPTRMFDLFPLSNEGSYTQAGTLAFDAQASISTLISGVARRVTYKRVLHGLCP